MAAKKPASQRAIPTLMVHGFHGGTESFDPLIYQAKRTAGAQRVLVAEVGGGMAPTLIGHWPVGVKRPIIQVVFRDNHANWTTDAQWLNELLQVLKDRYGIQQYNAVGHSRGCLALVIANEHHPALRLKRLALVAGTYDSALFREDRIHENYFLRTGQPAIVHPEYQEIAAGAHNFPKHLPMLLIAGDLDNGSDSDGVLTLVSTTSLKSALNERHDHIKQIIVHGRDAEHSALIRWNHRVKSAVIRFIW